MRVPFGSSQILLGIGVQRYVHQVSRDFAAYCLRHSFKREGLSGSSYAAFLTLVLFQRSRFRNENITSQPQQPGI